MFNFKYFYILCLSIVCIAFTSCGYNSTEEDKYPEMAEFPKVESDELYLERFYIGLNEIYMFDKELVAISFNDTQIYAITMDHNFLKIDSVKISSYYYVAPDGFIYYKNLKDIIEKVHYKTKEHVTLELHPFFVQGLYQKKLKELAPELNFNEFEKSTSRLKDSIRDLAAQYHFDEFKKSLVPDINGFLNIDNNAYRTHGYTKSGGTIITTDYGEFYMPKEINAHQWHKEFQSRITAFALFENIPELPRVIKWSYSDHIVTDALAVFDEVIIDNKSYGNHYAFSFYPVYYRYIDLELEDKTARFKAYDSGFTIVKSPTGNNYIICSDKEGCFSIHTK